MTPDSSNGWHSHLAEV